MEKRYFAGTFSYLPEIGAGGSSVSRVFQDRSSSDRFTLKNKNICTFYAARIVSICKMVDKFVLFLIATEINPDWKKFYSNRNS